MILRPLPFVALDVTGDVDAVRHFEREYGSAALPEAVTARVSLGVGRAVAGAPPSIERWHGRYRTVGWNASVTNDAGSTRIAIELAGRPRWFGLSLVQGYVVEPVLSVVAAEGGSVLLPAAAIEQNGSALVLLGSSGTGKSSLALRGLA